MYNMRTKSQNKENFPRSPTNGGSKRDSLLSFSTLPAFFKFARPTFRRTEESTLPMTRLHVETASGRPYPQASASHHILKRCCQLSDVIAAAVVAVVAA